MIKTQDFASSETRFALDADDIQRRDSIAIPGGACRVRDGNSLDDHFDFILDLAPDCPEQDAAALLRVGRLAVMAELAIDGLGYLQHSQVKPSEIAVAQALVREWKQSVLLPIPISTLRSG